MKAAIQRKEGSVYWKGISPDAIVLRFPDHCMNMDKVRAFRNGEQVSINCKGGGYQDIYFHAEGLIPMVSMGKQLGVWLSILSHQGVFTAHFSLAMSVVFQSYWDWDNPVHIAIFIKTLRFYGARWVRQEIAYDFSSDIRPVRVNDQEKNVHRLDDSYYSTDNTQTTREIEEDGKIRTESKGSRDSLVIVYNRGKKTASPNPIWRLEFRLQRHHLDRLDDLDLLFDFHTWVWIRRNEIAKYIRRACKPGTWLLKDDMLRREHWMLPTLLKQAEWVA